MDSRAVLLEVAADRDVLVGAFDEWRVHVAGDGELEDALAAWTLTRWGAPIPPVAFAMLLDSARRAAREGAPPRRRAKVPPRQIGETSLDYLARVARSNGWLPPGHAEPLKDMPEIAR